MGLDKINCCKDCIPPKRHPGCHGSCPEYLQERADLDKYKREKRKERIVKEYEDTGLESARIKRAKSRIKHDRYRLGPDNK